jgi:hypothetical protein
MKRLVVLSAVSFVGLVLTVTTVGHAQNSDDPVRADEGHPLTARLVSFNEPPALVSPTVGRFTATLSEDLTTIDYELSYTDFPTHVKFSHIHLGVPGTNGGVAIFLCSNDPSMPPIPACPDPGGTVDGSVTADNVLAITAQHLAKNDFTSVLRAIRNGAAYVNVHTNENPGGEIRGQIQIVRER